MESSKKNNMPSHVGGYFTLEAAFIVPFIMGLFIILIYLAFFLYDKCLLDQDYYLLSFRGSVMSNTHEGYGEVIYGRMRNRRDGEVESYIINRKNDIKGKYPALLQEQYVITVDNNYVIISGNGTVRIPFPRKEDINKQQANIVIFQKVKITNPIEVIRKERKE